jgi:two-component system chemotaxis sensor kinase CheA
LLEILSESVTLVDELVHRRPDAEKRCAQMISLLDSGLDDALAASPITQVPPANLDPDLFKSLTTFEVYQLQHCLKMGQEVFLIGCCLPLATIHAALPDLEQLLRIHGQLLATIPGVVKDGDRIDFHLLFCGPMLRNLGEHLPAEYRLRLRAIAPRTPRIDTPSVPQPQPAAAIPSQVVRVESQTLDELLEISKNLVLGQGQLKRFFQQLTEGGAPESSTILERSFQEMERGLLRLQRALNDARMIPVRFLFQRMTRVVTAAERATGKRVRLIMKGDEAPLDRGVLEQLHEPLLHLVRNAIDHGIETPDERVACGKPAQGVLVLEACQRSGQVAIEVRDDGRGIDLQRVQARAWELGFAKDGEALSNEQLYDLLVQPGFSTRTEVTEISGRGVGLDVVRCQLESLRGMVEVDSRTGAGTCITLTLPVHKTIIPVLVVSVAGRTYAMALEGICCIKPFEPRHDETACGDLSDSEAPLPLLDLGNYLHETTACNDGSPFLVVTGLGARQVGLVVEGLQGRREAVIRPFDAMLRQIPGFSAVAEVVGTGPVLLLDLAHLIRQATRPLQGKSGHLTESSPDAGPDLTSSARVPVEKPTGFIAFARQGRESFSPGAVGRAVCTQGNFISFFLCGGEYALDIMEVVEIIERADWINVPRAPSFISGVVLWRDQIVPVLDVAARMGIAKPSRSSHGTVLLVNHGGCTVAIEAERLGQLFHASNLDEAADELVLSQSRSSFLVRIAHREGRELGVLDLAALLDFSVTL